MASPEAKRTKIDSLRENFAYVSLGAKQKLNMEVESQEEETGELMVEKVKLISVEAGHQPSRQP